MIASHVHHVPYLFGYKTGFFLSRMTTNNLTISMKFAITRVLLLPFRNNSKDLDPSLKMDLDFWDCFGRNTVHTLRGPKMRTTEECTHSQIVVS